MVNGAHLASGIVTTAFETVDTVIALAPISAGFVIDLAATGATSSAGTLRLDNVVLTGKVSAIPLPPGFYLFATPLVGLALNRIGERYRQGQGSAPG